jgi:NAD binding domain of 6-phosphogluconate dehydrogenase
MATDKPMQLGMVGLGRMGSNLVRRLIRDGHRCVAYDRTPAVVDSLETEGADGANSFEELARKLDRPRNIWIMYGLERRRMLHCPVIGVARSEWSAAALRDHARRAIEDTGEVIDEHMFGRFAERLSMIFGDYVWTRAGDADHQT